jgi:hypothetical protein
LLSLPPSTAKYRYVLQMNCSFRLGSYTYIAIVNHEVAGNIIYLKYGDINLPKPPRFEIDVDIDVIKNIFFSQDIPGSSAVVLNCQGDSGKVIKVIV